MTNNSKFSGNAQIFFSRRHLMASAASLTLWSALPRIASAAVTDDPRLLVMILRGGLDGLALASPVGDPNLVSLRGPLMVAAKGEGAGLPLNDFFVLNPSMPEMHALYRKGEATIVHAVATPYRARSHFDGQDVLESGLGGVGRADSGWLNRTLAGMPSAGEANRKGLAVGAVVPLLMRGPAPVLSWIPHTTAQPLQTSTVERLADLYAHTDSALARAFAEGMAVDKVAMSESMATGSKEASPSIPPAQRQLRQFVNTAAAAAKLMSAADGPRAGVLSYNGWDTHANEGALKGQLANRLGWLDAAIKAYADGMGAAWGETVVVIATEFGRTARINGTAGTDHGTATVALLLGGAIKGGRVIADWPGLAPNSLYQGRDLKPTLDLRAVLKGVLRDHLGMPSGMLADTVFPSSSTVKPLEGLLA